MSTINLLEEEQLGVDVFKMKGEVCSKLISFGAGTNSNTEGDSMYLKKLFMRTKDFYIPKPEAPAAPVKTEVSKEEAKPSVRILIKEKKGKSEESNLEQITSYLTKLTFSKFKDQFYNTDDTDKNFRKKFFEKIQDFEDDETSNFQDIVKETLNKGGKSPNIPIDFPVKKKLWTTFMDTIKSL